MIHLYKRLWQDNEEPDSLYWRNLAPGEMAASELNLSYPTQAKVTEDAIDLYQKHLTWHTGTSFRWYLASTIVMRGSRDMGALLALPSMKCYNNNANRWVNEEVYLTGNLTDYLFNQIKHKVPIKHLRQKRWDKISYILVFTLVAIQHITA